jgi:hypothetical protein
MKNINLAVIGGDGIGPEVVAQGIRVLDKVAAKYDVTFAKTEYDLGAGYWHRTGEVLPDSVLAEIASLVSRVAPYLALGATLLAAILVPSFAFGMVLAPMADLLLIGGLLALSRVANGLADQIAGVVYNGAAAGDQLGFSVAFAGDSVAPVGSPDHCATMPKCCGGPSRHATSTTPPSSGAATLASVPPNLPTAVRAAATMTMSC